MPGRPSGRRKGQFFMLGALLLCALFFVALPSQVGLRGGRTLDMERLAENLEGEIPLALNLAMLEDGNPSRLGGFTEFVRGRAGERYLLMESMWVVAVPDTENPGEVELYAGNLLGRPVTLYALVDSVGETLALEDGETGSVTFYGVGSDFTLNITFGERSWSGQMARDKTNVYTYIKLSRDGDSVVKEIVG
jgi:hypothetical protein